MMNDSPPGWGSTDHGGGKRRDNYRQPKLSQKPCFGLQPLANDASAPLAIIWPILRETVPSDIVGFDAEGLLYDLGGAIAVVGADGLFE
jgi:hypothetical protein